ncbi:MAG TPA: hypothetical protein VJT13_15700 [Xanthobacteraceae bacterium]|nr:hypothetical protein [Xanthobacteraceae bacterium]
MSDALIAATRHNSAPLRSSLPDVVFSLRDHHNTNAAGVARQDHSPSRTIRFLNFHHAVCEFVQAGEP